MKASKSKIIISLVMCLLPIIFGIIVWDELPDKIPTHFDLNNNPNEWSSKSFVVFGLPCLMAAIDAVCIFGLNSDPKVKKHSESLDKIVIWFVPVLSCLLTPISLLIGMGKNINIALVSQIIIGIMFIVVGNYLPKCRQNYTVGIKLPWTLNDEENWNYTHRLGGIVWVISGVVVLVNTFFGAVWVMFAAIIIVAAVPMVASYLYYRKHKT